jgi:hypothetical protein
MTIRVISAVLVSVLTLSVISCRADSVEGEVVVTGKVKDTMLSNAQQFKFAAFASRDMENDNRSMVVICLENRDKEEFAIPMDSLVELEGFKDLKVQHADPDESLILAPLRERLNGKNVELSCFRAGTREHLTIFAVKAIKLPKDEGTANQPSAYTR